jgi:hypothetical protein
MVLTVPHGLRSAKRRWTAWISLMSFATRDIFLAQGIGNAVAHQAHQAIRLTVRIRATPLLTVDRLLLGLGAVGRPHPARWRIISSNA